MGYIGNQVSNAFTSMDKQVITGDGGTGYTLDHAVANAQEIEVFVNNVRQEPGVAYTVSGTTLTMTGNVASTDDFYVVYQGKAIQTVVPADDTITTAMLQDGAVDTTQIADDAVGADQIDSTASPTLNNLTLSGGLYVGGTGSANYLDDYEEGTWTPSIVGGTSGTATIGTLVAARYTKIGRIVHVVLEATGCSKGSISGDLKVTGLPFSEANLTNPSGLMRWGGISGPGSSSFLVPYIAKNESAIYFQGYNVNGYQGNVTDVHVSSTFNLYSVMITYEV